MGVSPEIAIFLIRCLGTAGVVIAVSLAVGRLGPVIGGALAGLPVVLGPGFWVLSGTHDVDFVALSAGAALRAQWVTQIFLLANIIAATRLSPWVTMVVTGVLWLAGAVPLAGLNVGVPLAWGIYAAITAVCYRIGAGFAPDVPPPQGVAGWRLLALRGLLAGVLVGAITLGADLLGARVAGALMAYPVAFSLIALTLHQAYGPGVTASALLSMLLGTTSLAVFCGLMALLVAPLPRLPAFALAVGAAVAATLAVIVIRRWLGLRRQVA